MLASPQHPRKRCLVKTGVEPRSYWKKITGVAKKNNTLGAENVQDSHKFVGKNPSDKKDFGIHVELAMQPK